MSNREQRLREILCSLPEAEADSLLDYAEFLLMRAPQKQLLQTLSSAAAGASMAGLSSMPVPLSEAEPAINIEPANIPRPETETIIGAVKRLSETYHMLSKDKMLHETADLVGQSMMGTRDTVDVIDDLERVFRRYYEKQFGLTDSS
ncbi:MAG TPA: Crp/Fnr family transcriptional regulator [Gammaproteobacteria bacterium]|nr:Crp/Fnr family transcriptional regulator [Gammaproteobacteria bacterium]